MSLNCRRCVEAYEDENGQIVAGKNVPANGCKSCKICDDCECFDTCNFFTCAMCDVGGFEKKHSFHDFSKSDNEFCHGCWPFAPECKEDDDPKSGVPVVQKTVKKSTKFFTCFGCSRGKCERKDACHDFSKSNNRYCRACWTLYAPENKVAEELLKCNSCDKKVQFKEARFDFSVFTCGEYFCSECWAKVEKDEKYIEADELNFKKRRAEMKEHRKKEATVKLTAIGKTMEDIVAEDSEVRKPLDTVLIKCDEIGFDDLFVETRNRTLIRLIDEFKTASRDSALSSYNKSLKAITIAKPNFDKIEEVRGKDWEDLSLHVLHFFASRFALHGNRVPIAKLVSGSDEEAKEPLCAGCDRAISAQTLCPDCDLCGHPYTDRYAKLNVGACLHACLSCLLETCSFVCEICGVLTEASGIVPDESVGHDDFIGEYHRMLPHKWIPLDRDDPVRLHYQLEIMKWSHSAM